MSADTVRRLRPAPATRAREVLESAPEEGGRRQRPKMTEDDIQENTKNFAELLKQFR